MFFLLYITKLYRIRQTLIYFFLECPIESCYVWADLQLRSLAKKAPGGRSLDMIIYSGNFGGVREE